MGVGHLGQHHAADPVRDARCRAGRRSPTPESEQAQAVAAKCGTVGPLRLPASCWNWSTPSRSPCPPACTARSPARSWSGASPRWSRSRWPARWPSPSSSSRWPEHRGAVLQVGHIERFNPALRALEQLAVRPKYINAERLSTYTFRSTDIGVVLDLMIHDLDLLLSHDRRAGAVGRGGGREPLRRARGRRQRPDRVRRRQRGQPDGEPGQLHAQSGRCGSGARRGTPRSTSPPRKRRWSARRNNSNAAGSTSKAST